MARAVGMIHAVSVAHEACGKGVPQAPGPQGGSFWGSAQACIPEKEPPREPRCQRARARSWGAASVSPRGRISLRSAAAAGTEHHRPKGLATDMHFLTAWKLEVQGKGAGEFGVW